SCFSSASCALARVSSSSAVACCSVVSSLMSFRIPGAWPGTRFWQAPQMHFEDVFAVLGVLLVGGALVAGYAKRTFLSLTVLVAWITHLVTDLGWTESFLVGALLSPTDPVLSSSVVTNPRVPRVVRHSLNLESGLNDGLALPAVLAFAFALDPSRSDFHWWT